MKLFFSQKTAAGCAFELFQVVLNTALLYIGAFLIAAHTHPTLIFLNKVQVYPKSRRASLC